MFMDGDVKPFVGTLIKLSVERATVQDSMSFFQSFVSLGVYVCDFGSTKQDRSARTLFEGCLSHSNTMFGNLATVILLEHIPSVYIAINASIFNGTVLEIMEIHKQ